ncbi:MAG: bifunctional diaminohydroxyphosphoribosylaminopyrimidine deaminase/5-amino-6-(5-phosphoribosylamino)uracil reductase RibD [Oscillospiraceae bacterium]|nr:bifunctional diaminohydroxyphosphoribosylaminopyrimidine deaminase/5-amino-6-(5-phosphoribosylamino)uracil reductase RibD [Oscillospiraceae bacterium]
MTDLKYMKRAIELAKKGVGWVNPNPMVGAVIVKDDKIIAEGWHHCYGEFHAERDALSRCTESPDGATMYVTLEPCCHHGKQPPCTDAILEAGIVRVVIGSGDPNPLVAGKGLDILRSHGIAVTEHVLEEECLALNRSFFHYIQTKRPYVTMKYAMTMDGKIACHTGASKWVTGEDARSHVQTLRHRHTGIMVGIGTVLADDPMLNCRMEGGRNPIRIVCDTQLRTPLSAQLVQTAKEIPTIIATSVTETAQHRSYLECGCQIITISKKNGHLNLNLLMEELGQRGIDSILLEGGSHLNWSALEAGIVREVKAYFAPKLFGGALAKSPVEGMGVSNPSECFILKNLKITPLGEDILIESEVSYVHGNR